MALSSSARRCWDQVHTLIVPARLSGGSWRHVDGVSFHADGSSLVPAISSSILESLASVRGACLRRAFATAEGAPAASRKPAGNSAEGGKEKLNFSDSLHLPKTEFSMRARSSEREPQFLERTVDRLYSWQEKLKHRKQFVLHDGPPYANGDLHIGHSLNKILKDMVCRYQVSRGRRVHFVPGWDCHGLPIEMKALQASGISFDTASPAEIRTVATRLATETINKHLREFRRWGVAADWPNPYKTMNRSYEARQMDVWSAFVERGLVFRGLRPVFWSPSSQTALAEAELEYPDEHVSRSVYFSCPLVPTTGASECPPIAALAGRPVVACVWTTTPWTLAANRALCVHPSLSYAFLEVPESVWSLLPSSSSAPSAASAGAPAQRPLMLVAEDLISTVLEALVQHNRRGSTKSGTPASTDGTTVVQSGSEPVVVATLTGAELVPRFRYEHPWSSARYPVVAGEHVTADQGTGIVHTAPGHGHDDFEIGRRCGLEIACPVNARGQFTDAAGPDFAGQPVLTEGTATAIDVLRRHGRLLAEHKYAHRYPYDWRTKQPVIIRATEQWFIRLHDLQPTALQAVDAVQWIPAVGAARITGMLRVRQEWCVSRQRVWGVPIPAFYDRDHPEVVHADRRVVAHVRSILRAHGSEAWWVPAGLSSSSTSSTADRCPLTRRDLIPPHLLAIDDDVDRWIPGRDTLDVWFDSGCSWYAALMGDPHWSPSTAPPTSPSFDSSLSSSSSSSSVSSPGIETSANNESTANDHAVGELGDWHSLNGAYPADLYLEGSDQHRGWFQSSLLTACALTGKAPYRQVLTHGFVLDESGRKMSKSLGNVVLPDTIVIGGKDAKRDPPYGADILRLWVSSCDFSRDVLIGRQMLSLLAESYRKIRNTCRFLLGNLNDFDPATDAISYSRLPPVDQLMVQRTRQFMDTAGAHFDQYAFPRVYQLLVQFTAVDCSSFYLDVVKDRLYADGTGSLSRRACQTVLWNVLTAVHHTSSPILCFLAEDVYEHYPAALRRAARSMAVAAEPHQASAAADDFSFFQNPWPSVPLQLSPSTDSSVNGSAESALIASHAATATEFWDSVNSVRASINRVLEKARVDGVIRSPLEARVHVVFSSTADSNSASSGRTSFNDLLRLLECHPDLCVTSSLHVLPAGLPVDSAISSTPYTDEVVVHTSPDYPVTMKIYVARESSHKCPRCWKYTASVENVPCSRCESVLHDRSA